MSEQQQNAIATARAVAASVDALSGKVDNLSERMGMSEADRRTLHRANRLNRILIVLVIVALLGAGSAVGYAISNGASISDLHAGNLSSCSLSNKTRSGEIRFWLHAYSLAHVNSHTPPKQRAEDNAIIAYVRRLFAPLDCAEIYHLGP